MGLLGESGGQVHGGRMTPDCELLPMRVDDPWLCLLAQGWRIEFMGLLMPWGAEAALWLVRDAD